MKRLSFFIMLAAVMLTSCEDHYVPDPVPMSAGMVYCSDGSILSMDDFLESGKSAKGVIFFACPADPGEPVGFAVSLYDETAGPFIDEKADEEGEKKDPKDGSQGTSCSVTDDDGFLNTIALRTSSLYSPIANAGSYSMDCYIPSVNQMQELSVSLSVVNAAIAKLGGQEIPSGPDSWYWTSTEVDGAQDTEAWKYSPGQNQRLPSYKRNEMCTRPVFSVYNYNELGY